MFACVIGLIVQERASWNAEHHHRSRDTPKIASSVSKARTKFFAATRMFAAGAFATARNGTPADGGTAAACVLVLMAAAVLDAKITFPNEAKE